MTWPKRLVQIDKVGFFDTYHFWIFLLEYPIEKPMNCSSDCQMVKEFGSLRSRIEKMKNTAICDFIYKTLHLILLNYYQK
jgi:hypothetical protein